MFVIPAIDVKGGLVVRAVAGRRKEYKPIKSCVCSGADPLDVASAFRKMGFGAAYLADLDAIEGGKPALGMYDSLTELGLKLLVDAGTSMLAGVERLLERGVWRVVVGTETLAELGALGEILSERGRDVIVSIDVSGRRVISRCPELRGANPSDVARLLSRDYGAEVALLIDIARVGTYAGVDTGLIKEVVQHLDVVVGGGIRGIADLLALKEAGAAGAVIASVLHDGAVTVEQLRELGFSLTV